MLLTGDVLEVTTSRKAISLGSKYSAIRATAIAVTAQTKANIAINRSFLMSLPFALMRC